MSFRLVPKLVTSSDLEWRNGPYFCIISPNLVASGTHNVKAVEDVVVKKFTFAISSPDEFLLVSANRGTREPVMFFVTSVNFLESEVCYVDNMLCNMLNVRIGDNSEKCRYMQMLKMLHLCASPRN